jgi:hypothetical protein
MNDRPESDWKLFRQLREVALERYCERLLEELRQTIADTSLTHHERYLRACRLLRERDRDLAHAFDDVRRSRMIQQLTAIQALGLLTPAELDRFSVEVRQAVQAAVQVS